MRLNQSKTLGVNMLKMKNRLAKKPSFCIPARKLSTSSISICSSASDNEDEKTDHSEVNLPFEERYQIEEKEILGEGCSSVVKKCKSILKGGKFAVKITRNDDEEYRKSS